MNVYVIDRTDKTSWCEDYKAVVVAKDKLHAERFARIHIDDFRKAKLEVREISLDEEQILSVENVGA